MAKIELKFKKEWTLWFVAAALFAILAGYALYSLGFLAGKINEVLYEDDGTSGAVTRFDFDTFNKVLSGKTIIPSE